MRASTMIAAAAAVALQLASADVADAACKRFAFLVNDYGKDVPTRDSQSLLDKHIATEMAALGVKQYKTGPKSVQCELFLNFIVFDEHTCQAEATVCWGGEDPAAGAAAAASKAAPATASAKPKAPAAAQPVTTGSVKAPSAPKAAAPAQPAKQ
jgi:hypothetical protein